MVGKLFLIEVYVDNIKLEESILSENPLVINVQLGNLVGVKISSDALLHKKPHSFEVKRGKSQLFWSDDKAVLDALNLPLEVSIAAGGKRLAGFTGPWKDCFKDVVMAKGNPVASLDSFRLVEQGSCKGSLVMLLRLGCFGNTTQAPVFHNETIKNESRGNHGGCCQLIDDKVPVLRLRGGVGSDNRPRLPVKAKSPVEECRHVMRQFDSILQEYRQLLEFRNPAQDELRFQYDKDLIDIVCDASDDSLIGCILTDQMSAVCGHPECPVLTTLKEPDGDSDKCQQQAGEGHKCNKDECYNPQCIPVHPPLPPPFEGYDGGDSVETLGGLPSEETESVEIVCDNPECPNKFESCSCTLSDILGGGPDQVETLEVGSLPSLSHIEIRKMEKTKAMKPDTYDMQPCAPSTCKFRGHDLVCEICKFGPGRKGMPLEFKKLKEKKPCKKVKKCKTEYPGCRIGHGECVVPFFYVPNKMGWLWNMHDSLAIIKNKKGWRPGAILRAVGLMIKKHKKELALKSDGQKKIKKVKSFEDNGFISPKPTLTISKRCGEYEVTMHPIKDPAIQVEEENPYLDCTPIKYKITGAHPKMPKDGCESCGCWRSAPSSDSELDIEVTTPAAIVNRVRPKVPKPTAVKNTQYARRDFIQRKKKKGKKKKHKKKGKK